MKHALIVGLLTLLFLGCKKDNAVNEDQYLQNVKMALGNSLGKADFQNLEFSKSVLSKVDSVYLYVLRIPFKGKSVAEDFVVVKTNKEGQIVRGRIIHQEGSTTAYGEGVIRRRRYDGSICISSLDRKPVLTSPVVDGYITALHPQSTARTTVLEAGMMPEIIISYTIQSGISWSSYMMLQSYFYDSSSPAAWGSYYGSMADNNGSSSDGGGPSGGSGGPTNGSDNSGGGPIIDPPLLIDVDAFVGHPAIDIKKFLKCFENIPDDGSTCSIELFTDIPVDNDPTKLFDWKTESPGHTFIQLMKRNGSQSAIQNIGFYPNSNWKNILDADPVDAKFVDDGVHEFNASIKMTLKPFLLRAIVDYIKQIAPHLKYDMDQYNCTDFAMDIFNFVRAPLDIPRYAVPGGVGTYSTRTPQGLYVKLKDMKEHNDPEAGNIRMGFLKAFVPNSDGPCN